MTKASVEAEESPSDLVMQYLKRQNRPYNAGDVHSNLKGKLQKTRVLKILEELHSQELINGKTYGKQVIYCAKQDTVIDKAMVLELEGEIQGLKSESDGLKGLLKGNSKSLQSLQNVKSIAELECILRELIAKNESASEELEGLKILEIKESADPEKTHEDYQMLVAEMKKRKKMFYNIWETVMENFEGDSKKLSTKLGIETDKDVKLDVAIFH